MFYHLIAITVAALAVVFGFRRGFARQVPSVLGMAFGIVCARLLSSGLVEVLYGAFPSLHGKPQQTFVYDTIASAIVFLSVYAIFRTITSFIGKVLHHDDRTILNNIGGAIYSLFKYMMFLSIVFNMLVAINPHSRLLKAAKSDDGNISLEVTLLSPALLGGENIEDLALKLQLEEAKKISKNYSDKNKNPEFNVRNYI